MSIAYKVNNNLDENNRQILGEILGVFDRKLIGDIYCKYFRSKMAHNNGMYFLRHTNDQIGGGEPELIEIEIDKQSYIFKIDQIVSDPSSDTMPEIDIYFLSLLSDSRATNCIWLSVSPGDHTGYINGIDKKYKSIGRYGERDVPVELYEGEDQGVVLIKALIKFCQVNRHQLGIDRLELNDIAERECKSRYGGFLISLSNMLQARVPYYMKYGFKPVEMSAQLKINKNIRTMASEIIEADKLIRYITTNSRQSSRELREFLLHHNGEKAALVLNQLMINDCDLYFKYYQYFYKYYQLEELTGLETAYEYHLDR